MKDSSTNAPVAAVSDDIVSSDAKQTSTGPVSQEMSPAHRIVDEIELKTNQMGSYAVSQLSGLIAQLRAVL